MKHTGFPKDDILDVFYFCYGFLLILPAHYRLFYGFPVKLIQLLKFSTKESLLIQFFCEPGIVISFPRPVPIFLLDVTCSYIDKNKRKNVAFISTHVFWGRTATGKFQLYYFLPLLAWLCTDEHERHGNAVKMLCHKLLTSCCLRIIVYMEAMKVVGVL